MLDIEYAMILYYFRPSFLLFSFPSFYTILPFRPSFYFLSSFLMGFLPSSLPPFLPSFLPSFLLPSRPSARVLPVLPTWPPALLLDSASAAELSHWRESLCEVHPNQTNTNNEERGHGIPIEAHPEQKMAEIFLGAPFVIFSPFFPLFSISPLFASFSPIFFWIPLETPGKQ